jgi:clusterin-associated protein 1
VLPACPPARPPACLASYPPACLPAGRIERRHLELDRAERRLDSLHAVKPAHSAEAEGLERELAGLYSLYLHK